MSDRKDIEELPPHLRFAFAPLVKRAMGFAVGLTCGAVMVLLNVHHWVVIPDTSNAYLWLMSNYFAGYDPEAWHGPLVGFFWAFWFGFVMGWFIAAARNFAVAVWIFVVRAKAQLTANRDFLDHI